MNESDTRLCDLADEIRRLEVENAELRKDRDLLEFLMDHEYEFSTLGKYCQIEILETFGVAIYEGESKRECSAKAMIAAAELRARIGR